MENINYDENKETENRKLEIVLNEENNNLRIGDMAPSFTANTTMGQINLNDYYGKWVILFSHPGDFTPVCTTEFIAFSKMNSEFEKRNAQLLGLSIDSNPSHLAWLQNIQSMTGIKVPFPLISDLDMKISRKYGMIAPNVSSTNTVRNVFFIDPSQKVRAILQYPMTNGRNIPEILRLLDALQMTDQNNVVTPANWLPGQPALNPAPKTYSELLNNINNSKELNCVEWYLCFDREFYQAPPFMPFAQNKMNTNQNQDFFQNNYRL